VATLPKLTVVLGVTPRSGRAAALAVPEHVLSLPLWSTAVTRAKYVALAVRPMRRLLICWPAAGADVDEATA
jgi:hypothetical protein